MGVRRACARALCVSQQHSHVVWHSFMLVWSRFVLAVHRQPPSGVPPSLAK